MTEGERTAIVQGATVYDRDGERIGVAADPGGAFFQIEEGILLVKSYYLPKQVIAQIDEDGVRLRIGAQEAEAMGREEYPGEEDNPWIADPSPEEQSAQ